MRSAEELYPLVSRSAGIVRRLTEYAITPSDPSLWYFTAEVVGHASLVAGVALDREAALRACLAEAAERYCGAAVDPTRLMEGSRATIARLGFTSLPSVRYVLPNGRMMESPPPGKRIAWIAGRSLHTGEEIWVPASWVYLTAVDDGSAERTSTGLAAGASVADAEATGLCEVVERDAVMVAWLRRRVRGRPNLEDGEFAEAQTVSKRHTDAGAEFAILDIRTDVPLPAYLAIARRRHGRPATAVGAACNPAQGRAAAKAACEAAHVHYLGKMLSRRYPAYAPSRAYREILTFSSRALLYAHPTMLDATAFLWQNATMDPAARPRGAASIEHALRWLAANRIEAVSVDVTAPEIADLGLFVVRVLVPDLQPLEADFNKRRYAPARLRSHDSRGRWWESLNDQPHPIP